MTSGKTVRAAFALLLAAAVPAPPSEACQVADPSLYSYGDPTFAAYSFEQSAACERGRADIFPCDNVDLLAHLPLDQIGGGRGNDVWGWRDRNREYALVGRSNGTAFVDLTDPENPVYLGNLPTQTQSSSWRDIKVYRGHAYVVADSAGNHGLQIFDLKRLRNVARPPVEFEPDAVYTGIGSAHNVVINEESGFGYVVGSEPCSGGLHMIDLRKPTAPVEVGCFGEDGFTHDAQCVIYRGPDEAFGGREICFAANEDALTVVDVTDKSAPVLLSRNTYPGSAYTHQGWLTEDHAYFLLDDEVDERRFGHNAKTYVWDTSDLTSLRLTGTHVSPRRSVDHNQYVSGNYTYQANYQQGLTILEITDAAAGRLEEVGFFDTHPETDATSFRGAWSVYPFFKSGAVLISDINRGLFIVRPRLSAAIFSDGFESGDLTAWSRVKGSGVAVVSPGLKESGFALEVTADGTDAVSQAVALQPAREKSLAASLLLKPNGIDLAGREIEILRFVAADKSTVLSLTLEQRGGRYRVALAAESGGELRTLGSTGIPRKRAIRLRVEWRQASSGGADDGVARLFKKKRARVEETALDTTAVIDAIRLGLPSGSLGANPGSYLVDDFLATR